jgi:predicted permease
VARLTRVINGVRAFFRKSRVEQDLDAELRSFLETAVEQKMRAGMRREEAIRAARIELGSIEAVKDRVRDVGWESLFETLWRDVCYAIRMLRRSPGFTSVAVLSLSLGIGANTAIFSLVDTVLVKSLPVKEPQGLFFIDNSGGKSGGNSGPPYPCYETLRDNSRFLAGIAAFDENRLKVTIDGTPEQLPVQYASGSYFEVLGIRAVLGRVLTPADDSEFGRGGPDGAVAVISHSLWKRRFGMDPNVLGKSIQVGTNWVTIVGVTPPEFFGLQVGSPIDISIPMMLKGNSLRSKHLWWLSVVGRIKPDATVDQARTDLDGLFDAYMSDIGQPRDRRGYFSGIELVPAARGLNALRRQFSEPLLIVTAIVGVVLLIGCANVANLLLARASARRSEISIRLAIGASRGRLIRQLLTEGVVLVSASALAGLLFARWVVSFLVGLFADDGHGILLNPHFDFRVLLFTAVIATLTALLFSLAPALQATRVDAAKPAAGSATSSATTHVRLGQSLVVIQVTLSVALLCSAALFLRTLHNLNAVETGFHREGVLTMEVEATVPGRNATPKTPDENSLERARLGTIWQDFIARVIASPGVTSAAVATMSPLSGRNRGVVIAISGGTPVSAKDRGIHINEVTAGYFGTMGIRVLSGRSFTPRDRAASPRVAILNDTAARAYFGAGDAIGRRVNFPGQPIKDDYEIVGVVRDARYEDLRTADERMAYLPIEQSFDLITNAIVAVRGPGDITRLVPSIRHTARETIPGGFVTRIATIEQQLKASLVRERLLSMLAPFFAGLALVLACIGLYGVMAYDVVRRGREIAIRIAIGARQQSVIWMVVRESLALVVLGAALGTTAALAAGRYVQSQLFGVAPGDPVAIAAAILLLMSVTTAAAYLPARRATRVDPLVALRCE